MEERKKKKVSGDIFWAVAVVVILMSAFCVFGWKYFIVQKIEQIALPPGCETVYQTRVHLSDVYWLHIKGEKVIKCELGYEAAKEYIEA